MKLLQKILFVAMVGVFAVNADVNGMLAGAGPFPPLPALVPGNPTLDFDTIFGTSNPVIPESLQPKLYIAPVVGAPDRQCVYFTAANNAGVPPPAAFTYAVQHAPVPANQHNIYFPLDGHQPTTAEATQYACANVVDVNITDWYVRAFGGDTGVELSNGNPVPVVDNAPPMGFRAGVGVHPHIIIANMGALNLNQQFWQEFRNIANTAPGRELLYRILIEIRRIDTGNGGRHCYTSGTERVGGMSLTVTHGTDTGFVDKKEITFNQNNVDRLLDLLQIYYSFLNVNALSDNAATSQLEQIFNHKQPLDIVLVSRNSPQSRYNAIELDEIALVFACLNASIHPTKIAEIRKKLLAYSPKYDANWPNISGYLNGALVALRKQKISEKFDEYCKQLPTSVSNSNWKIVIFNEMFFSKKPLTKHEVEKIRELFFFFLGYDTHTILHVNFLYATSGSFTVQYISELVSRITSPTSTGMRRALIDQTSNSYHTHNTNIANDTEISGYTAECNQKKQNVNVQYPVLLNRSTISYGNKELTWYDKSTYCWESNEALKGLAPFVGQKHIYHIGDGKDHKSINIFFPKLKDLLLNNISSEICYDLSCGIRNQNNWTNDTHKAKFHIFSSNTTQASESTSFPNDLIVACVDPVGTMLRLGGENNALTTVFFKKAADPVTIFPHVITCLPYDNKQYNFAIVKNLVFN